MRKQTLQEERRVKQRKERPQTHQHTKQQKEVPFQTTNKKTEQHAWDLWPTVLELSYIFTTTPQQWKVPWPQRERESTLTLFHICHRPCIPFGHVLIKLRCALKHCKKREGTHTQTTTKQGPVSNHKQTQKEQHVWDLWPDELRVVVYLHHTTPQRKAPWLTERKREHTYYPRHDWTHRRHKTLQEKREGCNKVKERPEPTTQTRTTKSRFKPQTKGQKGHNVWDLWPDEPRVVVHYIFNNTPQRKAPWPQRGRERVHLLYAIFVTAPVFHFETSWLNAYAWWNTARREKGATKKKTTKPTTQTTTKKVPFQTTTENKNNTCETCDPTNLELSYIFNNTPQRKAMWPTERKREYTYWMP